MSKSVERIWGPLRRGESFDREAFAAYRANPTQAIRNRLAAANVGLAEKVARRWTHQCQEPFEDLRNEGMFGLLKAVERYDPATGFNFSSFAIPFISGAIQHYLRDKGWGQVRPPRRTVEQYGKVKSLQRRMADLGREMDSLDIAAALGISADEWRFIEEAREQPAPISLDDSPLDIAEELPATLEGTDELFSALATLPRLTYECLVEFVFGGLSEQEIAARKRLNPVQVKSLIARVLSELREKAVGIDYG